MKHRVLSSKWLHVVDDAISRMEDLGFEYAEEQAFDGPFAVKLVNDRCYISEGLYGLLKVYMPQVYDFTADDIVAYVDEKPFEEP